MRWRHLQAFRETIVTGTVSGAAEIMGISQPAVSRLIDALERDLSMTLFDRTSGRLVPTAEALMFYEQVQQAFRQYEELYTVAQDIKSGRKGSLHVACLPSLGLGFLPSAVADFARRQPDVAIRYDLQLSMRVESWVSSQQVDLGLAEFPCDGFGFEREEFVRKPYVMALPEAHPLADKVVLEPDDLARVPLVSLGSEATGRKLLDACLTDAGVRPKIVCETLYASGVCELARLGMGIGMVDLFTAHDFANRGVVFRRFEPSITFHVGLLYPRHHALSRAAAEFVTVLRQKRAEVLSATEALLQV